MLGGVLLGVSAAIVTPKPPQAHAEWTATWEAYLAYGLFVVAGVCAFAAARGWRFPFVRQSGAAAKAAPPLQEQEWRPSEHGLLGNATHYMDQAVDERLRRATQPDP